MRALLSVWDKTGLVELGTALRAHGVELVASGGTARALSDADLPVTTVADLTGFPHLLGGRVKTLHPAVHGGILARRTPEHLAELKAHGLGPIDIVVCNLYPFTQTIAQPDCSEADAIEQIDIGGVTLLRAAAKNFESVAVLSDPADYAGFVEQLSAGDVDRRALAKKAFRQTAAYDAAIASWFTDDALPAEIFVHGVRAQTLRYGENPHQVAALYRFADAKPAFEQLQGKALSFNNIWDLDAAWAMPHGFEKPAVAIIKHTNPCGLAVADDPVAAFLKALACDPISAFGSIIAVNRTVTAAFVDALGKLFVEVIAAPAFDDDALAMLARKKKNCRVMRGLTTHRARPIQVRSVADGLLVQTWDSGAVDEAEWRVVSKRAPTDAEWADLRFAWIAAQHVKSNAIVFGKDGATVGVGAGQMNRIDSVRLAAWRSGEKAQGASLASDAFFPFADGIEAAAEAGITAVIQPGGSIRDAQVIEAVDALGLAMVLTGRRHFRH